MAQAEVGLIGLGVMGSNLALNLAEKGHVVAVYNRTAARTGQFFEAAGDLRANLVPCATLEEFIRTIRPPRPIIIMIEAGEAVDNLLLSLERLAARGDIFIDAGNANFRDTERRLPQVEAAGFHFMGVGVSGGAEGARHGPSIMAGGSAEAYSQVEPFLKAIAARHEGEPCVARLGPGGAGHFVKTIHNGIEYADMQMIAEVYGLLRDGAAMPAAAIGACFQRWNKGRLNSYLVEITAAVLAARDPQTGEAMVDRILDRAGQKGTGRWAVIEAQQLAVPATAIEAAVAARALSALKHEREAGEMLYGRSPPAIRPETVETLVSDLEQALLAGRIAAYAQGFAVMAAASREFAWDIPLAIVARIWRAGCIIRSALLGDIAAAFDKEDAAGNLLGAPHFVALMKEAHGALRRTVARAAEAAVPMPALAAALAYFDGWRQARGTANLIQAQRDFFGAHGFERLDAPGTHHGPWLAGNG
jgi:6-phosphogluconate dehydrogenase